MGCPAEKKVKQLHEGSTFSSKGCKVKVRPWSPALFMNSASVARVPVESPASISMLLKEPLLAVATCPARKLL
jgi:hypothetical protein